MGELRSLMLRHDAIGDARGLGLMAAIDFVKDRESRESDAATRNAVVQGAFRRGLLLLGCGDSAIRFSPGLIVTRNQIDTAIEILDAAIGEVVSSESPSSQQKLG